MYIGVYNIHGLFQKLVDVSYFLNEVYLVERLIFNFSFSASTEDKQNKPFCKNIVITSKMEEATTRLIQILNFTEEFGITTKDSFMDKAEALLTFKVGIFIATYWTPIWVPIGLVGNILSFLVMVKPTNRKLSTCIYMAAISVNDSMMMCLVLYVWLVSHLKILESQLMECKVKSFLIVFALQNATYQVVAMTVDKFIAVKWPHKAATYSTPKRAKWISIVICVCVIIYNIPDLIFTQLIGQGCVSYAVGGIYAKMYSWLTFILNAVVPLSSLTVMNLTIIHEVRKSRKLFGSNGSVYVTNAQMRTRNSAENQLTVMLLLVTTLFVLLMIPTYARFLYFTYVSRDTPEKYASAMLFFYLSTRLYFTNSGINFYLYCISGRKFRDDLKELLCFGRKIERTVSISTVHTNY